ncbi:MAG: hypothetical protein H7842_10000 [Gammaproteobacteria bacterium SHHR-1]|uniref:hypothetical protein n=1 Tax=Magnetovirga frankeli TaxID=947516 RepID=UPI00129361C1|nr:hypothetical protein D5125_03010 [gamma proteobacterium SS-5]
MNSSISNDREMKTALQGLDAIQQRLIGAQLVESVMDLCNDERLRSVLNSALDAEADADRLGLAQKTVKQAVLDSHARCGAAGDWQDQATYFVGRALHACLSPQVLKEGKSPAWQAALSCRMARTSAAIDQTDEQEDSSPAQETTRQYVILSRFLENL